MQREIQNDDTTVHKQMLNLLILFQFLSCVALFSFVDWRAVSHSASVRAQLLSNTTLISNAKRDETEQKLQSTQQRPRLPIFSSLRCVCSSGSSVPEQFGALFFLYCVSVNTHIIQNCIQCNWCVHCSTAALSTSIQFLLFSSFRILAIDSAHNLRYLLLTYRECEPPPCPFSEHFHCVVVAVVVRAHRANG